MKLNAVSFLLSATFATLVLTQSTEDPGPSPTASVGCEPHGDHWHCDGPRAAGVATTTSAAAAAAQDEETATPSFPPPTESVGCEAHGDHYHCAGPVNGAATATTTATSAAAAAEEEAEEHDHAHEGETPAFPAPTESVGCEGHGDHYDCAGPASAAQATAPPTPSGAVGGTNETSTGTNGTSAVPFEGAASNSRVIPPVAMTGLFGVMALVLVL
ncbi:MAG: hypothetical protein L6R38_008497 [Xanthoria sp. 2 TBL-2021]|nr:MAG: hypothetical protein L6R38_008497 [Xanthoria sp. 2 TBL-2021]